MGVENKHLYPFTLAFDQGLKDGTISLDIAETFADRIFDAVMEAKVRANPHLKKDPIYSCFTSEGKRVDE